MSFILYLKVRLKGIFNLDNLKKIFSFDNLKKSVIFNPIFYYWIGMLLSISPMIYYLIFGEVQNGFITIIGLFIFILANIYLDYKDGKWKRDYYNDIGKISKKELKKLKELRKNKKREE